MSELKYTFKCYFKDGSVVTQSQSDLSVENPSKSAYFDVAQNERAGNLPTRFELTDGVKTFAVDLQDGHFEVNGLPFRMHELDIPYYNRRLIYFRRHTHTTTSGGDQAGHTIVFRFGWQGNVSADITSANYQQVMELD